MRVRVLAAGLVAALVVGGCGPGGAPVDGKVVIGDKAYNPETDGDLTVGLNPSGGGGAGGQNTARVQPDGTFHITSATGGGVPPGKYKVSVTRYPSKADMAKLKGPPTPVTKEVGEEWDVAAGKTFTLDMSKVK
jgi:hypothetical protein